MNCQNLREQQYVYHPRVALAMFFMAFVGVVRGLWGLKNFSEKSVVSVKRNNGFTKTLFAVFLQGFLSKGWF